MASPHEVAVVLEHINETLACPLCETRLRFGDGECPHCGEDMEPYLRTWAERLADALARVASWPDSSSTPED